MLLMGLTLVGPSSSLLLTLLVFVPGLTLVGPWLTLMMVVLGCEPGLTLDGPWLQVALSRSSFVPLVAPVFPLRPPGPLSLAE